MVDPILKSLEKVDKEKTSTLVEMAKTLVDTKKAIEESEKKTKDLKEKAGFYLKNKFLIFYKKWV